MQIGDYQIRLIEAGNFGLDGGAMFGVVPKTLWTKAYQVPDEMNRIELSTRLLYLEGNGRKILVDTGNGTKLDEKSQKIYKINSLDRGPAEQLKSIKIDPTEITDVILTHLHFDHVGGATEYDENGVLRPTFENAKYYVQKKQLEWARNPSPKDRASFMPENYEPLVEEGLLETIEGEGELFPGIHVKPLDGHTKAMQMLTIDGKGSKDLVYFADLCPTSAHLKLPYVMGYDNYPLTTLEEKKKYLLPAAEESSIVVFEHDAFTKFGRLQIGLKGPEVVSDNAIVF